MPFIDGVYYTERELEQHVRRSRSSSGSSDVEKLLVSGAVAAVTGSALLGGVVGGSFLGGILGDGLFDD